MGGKYEVRGRSKFSDVWRLAEYPNNVFMFLFYAIKALILFDEVVIRKNRWEWIIWLVL